MTIDTYLERVGRNFSSRGSIFTEWFSLSFTAGVSDEDGLFRDKLDTFRSVLGHDSSN